jgi:LacI family transcriptional regulator
MKSKKITIRDIAKMANVSHTTVSRVLNDNPKVKEETRQRILKMIELTQFVPDQRARNFAQNKSNLIGMVVPDIRNPFYAELARGVEDKAYQEGYNVIFCSTDKKPERMETYIPLLLHVGVGGLIFSSARLKEPVVQDLVAKEFPLVLVSRKIRGENFNYVVFDNFKGAYDITKHLIDIGYRKIAIVVGPSIVSTGFDRLRGYQQALKDNKIPVNDDYIVRHSFERLSGYDGANKLLALNTPPEAVFAGSDYIAMGVIDAIEEHGLRTPEDIALVGFDNTEYASNKRINLTTVSQGEYEMGNIGVSILIDDIERRNTLVKHRVIIEPRLIIRDSCGYNLRRKSGEDLRRPNHSKKNLGRRQVNAQDGHCPELLVDDSKTGFI